MNRIATVSFNVILNKNNEKAFDELSKITHHIDYLLDLDNWSNVIDGILDVEVKPNVALSRLAEEVDKEVGR